jgi:hypothetical protein
MPICMFSNLEKSDVLTHKKFLNSILNNGLNARRRELRTRVDRSLESVTIVCLIVGIMYTDQGLFLDCL